ncbi:MAG: adenosine deaminase [Melioribacteraceae bacterium]
MEKENILEIVKKMPKVELHLHLEGAFTFEFLFGLIKKYNDGEIKSIDELKQRFIFKDFQHFIEMWFWKNKFFKMVEDFEESTYQTIKNLSSQNVIYAEVFFSPWDFEPNGLKVEAIAEATISGIIRAESEFPIKCGLIVDIVRNHGSATAMNRLNQITPFLNKGIIGLGLGGNERDFPASDFKEVFREAKKRGFRLTAHAGEAAGPESVWSAILDLEAERIGHGVRAIEDQRLVNYIIDKKIPLEVCITSNLMTKVYSSLYEHPFPDLFMKGVSVTINSDDPPMFGADITDELFLLYNRLNYSVNDLLTLTRSAINASFLNNSEKKKYHLVIDNYATSIH